MLRGGYRNGLSKLRHQHRRLSTSTRLRDLVRVLPDQVGGDLRIRRCRRLVKDYERYAHTIAGFHVIAFVGYMLKHVAAMI